MLPDSLRLSGKRHCLDMPYRLLINERCEHCSKSLDFFQWKQHMVNFSVQNCIGAEVSYKSVIFKRTLIRCLHWIVTFSFSKLYYSEL